MAGDDVTSLNEQTATYGLTYTGPPLLPFDHIDVRVYIDSLFLEGLLAPIATVAKLPTALRWATVGIQHDPRTDQQNRFRALLAKLEQELPSDDAPYQAWQRLAHLWAEFIVVAVALYPLAPKLIEEKMTSIQAQVDSAFLAWMQRRYASLYNQPPSPPVMVHHIPRTIARRRQATPQAKVALVVVDGLALDQWVLAFLQPTSARASTAIGAAGSGGLCLDACVNLCLTANHFCRQSAFQFSQQHYPHRQRAKPLDTILARARVECSPNRLPQEAWVG